MSRVALLSALFSCGWEGRRDGGEGRLNILTEGHVRTAGPLGENFWFGCVSGVTFLAPIARDNEAGKILLIEFRASLSSNTRCSEKTAA